MGTLFKWEKFQPIFHGTVRSYSIYRSSASLCRFETGMFCTRDSCWRHHLFVSYVAGGALHGALPSSSTAVHQQLVTSRTLNLLRRRHTWTVRHKAKQKKMYGYFATSVSSRGVDNSGKWAVSVYGKRVCNPYLVVIGSVCCATHM